MSVLILTQLLFWSLSLAAQPNILFILTDDQGKFMGGLEHMPILQETLVQNGTTYSKHFCSTAVCCPSRANIWTGRMPHNTNVTNVSPPYGGFPKVVSAGWNDNYLPIWMQDAGYTTYYVGKLWNAHTPQNYDKPFAKGFDQSDFLLDPWTYRYYAAKMTRNGGKPVSYAGQYSTDVLAEKALGFLDDALKNPDKPWMLTVAPNAPHSNGSSNPAKKVHWFGEPEYAPRHANMFKNYQVPRDESFNTVIEGAVGWVGKLPKLSQKEIDYVDEFQRCRLRALQAVDEMMGRLVSRLDEAGVLDNTYIFYTTDNGYHVGQHAMQPGKNCGYDTDINVPMIVRGPGVPRNSTADMVTSHTDIAPTLLSLAGTTKDGLDGKPIPLTAEAENADRSSEHVAIEYWGRAVPEGIYGYMSNKTHHHGNSYRKNTYKGVRLVSDDYSLYYAKWCTNEREFYNLKDDPLQTVNMAADLPRYDSYSIAGRNLEQIFLRLNALMMVLKSCNGDSCREPWRQLHPEGNVTSLAEALDGQYDMFYSLQPQVAFTECSLGYLIWTEGPQHFNIFNRQVEGGEDDESSKHLPDTEFLGRFFQFTAFQRPSLSRYPPRIPKSSLDRRVMSIPPNLDDETARELIEDTVVRNTAPMLRHTPRYYENEELYSDDSEPAAEPAPEPGSDSRPQQAPQPPAQPTPRPPQPPRKGNQRQEEEDKIEVIQEESEPSSQEHRPGQETVSETGENIATGSGSTSTTSTKVSKGPTSNNGTNPGDSNPTPDDGTNPNPGDHPNPSGTSTVSNIPTSIPRSAFDLFARPETPLNICFSESSMPALCTFEAIPESCVGIMAEVWMSSDGVPFLLYKSILPSLNVKGDIETMEWEEVQTRMPHKVLTFHDLLGLFRGHTQRESKYLVLDIKSRHHPSSIFHGLQRVLGRYPDVDWKRRMIFGVPSEQYFFACQITLRGYPMFLNSPDLRYANKTAISDNNYEVHFKVDCRVLMSPQGVKLLADTLKWRRAVYADKVETVEQMKWCIRRRLWGVITERPWQFDCLCREQENVRLAWKIPRREKMGIKGWARAGVATGVGPISRGIQRLMRHSQGIVSFPDTPPEVPAQQIEQGDNQDGSTQGNSEGNTAGNTTGNTAGNTVGNSEGNTQGNTQGNTEGNT